jgi:hypothetical protein
MALELAQIIQTMRAEAFRLDAAIAALENLGRRSAERLRTNRRGRKSMGADERLLVAARMKRYWAGRRNERKASTVVPR